MINVGQVNYTKYQLLKLLINFDFGCLLAIKKRIIYMRMYVKKLVFLTESSQVEIFVACNSSNPSLPPTMLVMPIIISL